MHAQWSAYRLCRARRQSQTIHRPWRNFFCHNNGTCDRISGILALDVDPRHTTQQPRQNHLASNPRRVIRPRTSIYRRPSVFLRGEEKSRTIRQILLLKTPRTTQIKSSVILFS